MNPTDFAFLKTPRGLTHIFLLVIILINIFFQTNFVKYTIILFFIYTILLLAIKKCKGLQQWLGVATASSFVLITFSLIPTKFYVIALIMAFTDAAWHGF